MAKHEILIPFILHSEAGLPAKYTALPYREMFERARATGYANVPGDSGGPTMCGITLATYTAWRRANRHPTTTVEDLRNISYEEWSEIFRQMFWNRWKADEINDQSVANALADWVWASGKYGITEPQRVLGVKADGIVGPKTLAAINNHPDPQKLFERLQEARLSYHTRIVSRNAVKRRFLRGWQNRVNKITYQGFKYE